jgi:outer membrane protein TolC
MGPRLRRPCWLLSLLGLLSMAKGPLALAQQRPPSPLLLRSLEAFARDVQRLDQTVPDENPAAPPSPLSAAELQAIDLPAPSALALPNQASALTVQRRVLLSLPQALALAVRNDPDLAEQVAAVRERQGLLAAVQGRLLPELGLAVGGAFSQLRASSVVWQDNAGLYPADSPFLVEPNGRNTIQTNLGLGSAALRLDYELLSFERSAALGQFGASLGEARQRYANRVRQLQLEVSEAYYGLQLADQLWRIRQAVTLNDTVVRDQVAALKASGLVPRVDLLRAEADLQQGRFRLSQADAQRLSRQRQLSNLINVPFDVTLVAPEAIRLLPPWPLDLQQTLMRGWTQNPQLLALQQARQALLLQADRQAASLLPSLRLFAQAGVADGLATRPVVQLEGCCSESVIPQVNTGSADWAAGVSLNWKLFDGGVSAGQVSASRAAAQRTEQASARERNAIRQRLESAYFDHTASLDQILAARAAYRAAREAFRDVRARYQLGLADYTDVSDTIRRLTEAMEARAEAVTLANVSYARLLRELLPVSDRPDQSVVLPLVLP